MKTIICAIYMVSNALYLLASCTSKLLAVVLEIHLVSQRVPLMVGVRVSHWVNQLAVVWECQLVPWMEKVLAAVWECQLVPWMEKVLAAAWECQLVPWME